MMGNEFEKRVQLFFLVGGTKGSLSLYSSLVMLAIIHFSWIYYY